MLAPAPPSEGRRGKPVAGADAGRARAHGRSRRRRGAGRRLSQRRHDRVPARGRGRRRALLFPRDEHAAAGRASGDGSGHRRRSGAGAAGGGRRRAAALDPGRARRSAATPSSAASTPRIRRADFLPQAGPLLLYREPSGPGIRVDAGVVEGDEIGVELRPACSPSWWRSPRRAPRRSARAVAALRAFPILGIRTNIPFLIRAARTSSVRRRRLHTGFVDDACRELTRRRRRARRSARRRRRWPVTRRPGPAIRRQRPLVQRSLDDARAVGPLIARWMVTARATRGREYRVDVTRRHGRARERPDATTHASIAAGAMRLGNRTAWAIRDGDARWVFVDGQVVRAGRSRDRRHGAAAAPTTGR